MIALFGHEGIKAWCNGKRVIWLGIKFMPDEAGGYSESAVLNTEDGHVETWEALSNVVTEWHWNAKLGRWEDVSEQPEDDE